MGQHYCQLTSKQKHDILGRGNYASPLLMSDQFEFKPKNLSEKELEKEISDILKMSSNCKECDPSNTEITDQLENSIDENFMPNIGVSSDEINRLYQEQLKKTNTTLPKEIEKQSLTTMPKTQMCGYGSDSQDILQHRRSHTSVRRPPRAARAANGEARQPRPCCTCKA